MAFVLHGKNLFLARAKHQCAKIDIVGGIDAIFGVERLDWNFDWISVYGLTAIQIGFNNLEQMQ